jgi:hypothetical protein
MSEKSSGEGMPRRVRTSARTERVERYKIELSEAVVLDLLRIGRAHGLTSIGSTVAFVCNHAATQATLFPAIPSADETPDDGESWKGGTA